MIYKDYAINSDIASLGRKANWKQDVVDKGITKTIMPDMYENEVSEKLKYANFWLFKILDSKNLKVK